MAFTTVALTGQYYQADGVTPATGNVTFVAATTMTDSSTNVSVSPTRVTATLDGTGAFSVSLTATNDPTTQPRGVTYEVTERITGAAENKFNIELDYSDTTQSLADIVPTIYAPVNVTAATQDYVDEQITAKTSFVFTQSTPSTSWAITHNLGYRPSVFIVDTSYTVLYGNIRYTSDNALVVTFEQSTGGYAYLS